MVIESSVTLFFRTFLLFLYVYLSFAPLDFVSILKYSNDILKANDKIVKIKVRTCW